jgi:choline dehydrogenase-like flavoprotein
MIVTELPEQHYSVAVIGSGFGSLFFIHQLLQRQPDTRVVMLERGAFRSWDVQAKEGRNSSIPPDDTFTAAGAKKHWNFTVAYGGGTNCWGGATPRMHPNDFRLKSKYGRGQDWPITYNDLEPYYAMAEAIMDISGPNDLALVTPRSAPYPQPPHRMSAADRVMKAAQPDLHFAVATARARVANSQRAACCASFQCDLCPADAKFTALNGFAHITHHPNVHILCDAEVREIEISGGTSVSAIRYRHEGRDRRIRCDLCVLGANAIHSPAILLRSGVSHPLLGRGLNEQLSYGVEVFLNGLDNLDGSTKRTGLNYSLYDGSFRAEHGAAYIQFDNQFPYGLRPEFGRWSQIVSVKISVEEELRDDNHVAIDKNGDPVVHFAGRSPYAKLAVQRSLEQLPKVLAPLPVEEIVVKESLSVMSRETVSHLQGTLRMGSTNADSVVDHAQVHHDLRNLIVVGTSVMPSCPPVEPSLTAAALSLRAADLVFAKDG